MIDVAALTSAVYERLRSESAGAALRALLGADAASVLLAEDVRVEGLLVRQLPVRPLIALRRGAVPTIGRVVNRPIYTWYCYDDPAAGYGAIEALIQPLAEAYTTELIIGTVAVGDIEVSAGGQTRDDVLKLLMCPVTVVIGAV